LLLLPPLLPPLLLLPPLVLLLPPLVLLLPLLLLLLLPPLLLPPLLLPLLLDGEGAPMPKLPPLLFEQLQLQPVGFTLGAATIAPEGVATAGTIDPLELT